MALNTSFIKLQLYTQVKSLLLIDTKCHNLRHYVFVEKVKYTLFFNKYSETGRQLKNEIVFLFIEKC